MAQIVFTNIIDDIFTQKKFHFYGKFLQIKQKTISGYIGSGLEYKHCIFSNTINQEFRRHAMKLHID